MTADPEHPVAPRELAELRRSIEVGLTRIEGGLALLTQRDDQTAKDLDDLSARVVALEHTRWPLPTLAAVAAVGAVAVAVWQALGH
ncbi:MULTISPECIES: hypothetical protein [unclassified Streptomyces]|uniref:hypothetical protein n=1 Tax=unclassified Streptomyces TaxID=2593676 RepID=UPI00225937CF|nr:MULTISPECIES: hypothetical protein [unclassified Streptomyces]WTB42413.1 hypothetical protein OG569_32680 [Streptomyces sp. NBC_00827]WUC09932.1 hypothetical protein OG256_08550 [Streptomyces sp. NBC_00564]WUC53571.1 hypothetical protein OG266_36570 [Streptomyces sp. NBC_00554]MCX4975929.1 hypothetical protein [Streptomyces sp. NBC_00620]MCX5556302.1 hypothetical protein [Streptomyces sp. NBC_00038]